MNNIRLSVYLLLLTLPACSGGSTTPTAAPTAAPVERTALPTAAPTPTAIPSPTSALPADGVILYRGDPQRTGAYDLPALRDAAGVLWQADLGPTSLGSPVFADGALYVGTQDGRMRALDGQTGEELWAFDELGGYSSPIAIAGDRLIVGSSDENVIAVDLDDQSQVWSHDVAGSVWGAPLVVGDVVYVVSERGAYALNLQSGEAVWEIETGDHQGFVGSPAHENGTLFFEAGPVFFAADAATGEILWQIERGELEWFYGPALADGLVYVGSDDGHFYALDQETGEEVWRSQQSADEPGGSSASSAGWSAPSIADGVVYVGNIDQHIYAFDAATGEELWKFETADWAASDPVISDGVVYAGVGNHMNQEGPRPLYAIDAVTGQELWQFMADSRLMTAAALGPGTVYAVTIGGTVYALSEAAGGPTPELEAGQWSQLVYHESLEQVVLVNGGPESGKPAEEPLELWGWDGEAWTLIDDSGPPWRNWAGVAYDSGRDVLVVHGGHQGGEYFDETWEWDGETWTIYEGGGPGGREGAGMVYDSGRGMVVLYGGAIEGPEIVGDTWEWDGATWTQVATSGPPARFPAGTGYDPLRGQVLVYGGHDVRTSADIPFFEDFWAWDGESWQEVPASGPDPGVRVATSFVFDPVSEQVLMFGGADLDAFRTDLWSWDSSEWTLISEDTGMPPRSGFNIVAYDAAREVYVLFGGVDRPGGDVVGETWEWDGEAWACKAGCGE